MSNRLTNPRFLFVYPLIAWVFLTAHTTEHFFRIGIILVLLGELLRFWANGYVGHVKIRQLMTSGPYGRMRHPLYGGSFLIALGICFITGNIWFSIIALVFLYFVYQRQISHEESILFREWGESYQDYQRKVPRFGWAWRKYKGLERHWSWQGIWASKEWKTVLWVIVILIALYFREEFLQEKEFFPANEFWKQTLLIVAAFSLALVDGVFELTRRWRSRKA